MKMVSNFNERFKEAFGDRSVTEFAAEIGVAKQTISSYLNGIRKPKGIVTGVIANRLNVNPAWLMGYDVPKELARDENQKSNTEEYIRLFGKLSYEQQKIIIAQIKGILSDET